MPQVYVSIGSNIEREKNVRGAITALRAQFGNLEVSHIYQCKAVGFSGEDFFNLVAAFDSDYPLEQVHDVLAQIEIAHGRAREATRHGARTLDIDILIYGDTIRHDERYDIPRSEIREHVFVLGPLVEIAPALRDPETGESYAKLWEAFRRQPGDLREVTLDLSSR